MKITTKQKELVEELTNELKMDLVYYLGTSEAENIDELVEYLQEQGAFNIEIIYYYKAIDYLKENDPSLENSLEIAEDFGYELKNLNSEILASLLASQEEEEQFNVIRAELEEILFPEQY